MNAWEIDGYTLEYLDDIHTYLVDGLIVPSITQILKIKFGNKYSGINQEVLNNAANEGTRVHKAIENFEKLKAEDITCQELKDYKFLKKTYKFECLDNEVPIILFKDNKPIAAGRLDLVLEIDKGIYLGDIKRTSVLDKEYLAYQLNLYKIGYEQCYKKEIKGLKGLHLRAGVRKFVDIPVNEELAWNLVKEYLESEELVNV